MPEEHNRRVADHLSSLLLVHSRGAEENLAREGIAGDHVVLVGNTMIDALVANVRKARRLAVWRRLGLRAGGYVLVTLHRPALVDTPELLARTMAALGAVARELPVVFPVHPRTLVRLRELGQAEDERVLPARAAALPPLPLARGWRGRCRDGLGGVQEETTALGVPCFTLRDNTERPVTVTDGTNTVLGLDPERISDLPRLLQERPSGRRLPPLWDGRAGARAADAIERALAAEPVGHPDAEGAETRLHALDSVPVRTAVR